jgi:hypothetical protein
VATHTNLPPFDLIVHARGVPSFNSPALYADTEDYQSYVGTGEILTVYKGCVIDSFESNITVDNQMIMESCQFRFLDMVTGDFDKLRQSVLNKAI